MGFFSFGGGMGFGSRKSSDKEVNLFSMSKEDRARQRELLARQERQSMIQIGILSFALLFVLVTFFVFRGYGQTGKPTNGKPGKAADSSDKISLENLLNQLVAPDVRPSPEELAPEFEPLATLDTQALAAGIDETDLKAADAFRRNRPKPAAVAQALRYLRTHLEQAKDFKPAANHVAVPFEAVQHPETARGQFELLQGVLERVEPDFFQFVTFDDAALQKATGVKELHLYYFDVAAQDRERFYFGRDVYPVPEITGSGVTAKANKFAVLAPSDLSPIETANLAPIDTGGKPKAHMIFNIRMQAIFLGNHLVLPIKLANNNQRVTVPLYLAVDPLPWRSDQDKMANLGPKVKTSMASQPKTPGALEPLPETAAPAGEGDDTTADTTPGPAPSDADWKGGAPAGLEADAETPFEPMSTMFKPLAELTGQEDAFYSIPTGNSIEEIKEAANYTHSFEPFHLLIRYLRSHTPAEIHAYRLKREETNAQGLGDGAKATANYTNVRHDPEPYYAQPYEFQGWVTMCLSPRDYWAQEIGQDTGLKADSGVRHTSTWILKDDRGDYYCVTVPQSTREILGPEFRGDLNHLQDLNLRVQVQGLLLQRLPVQKRLTLEFDTMPMYAALELQKVVRPESTLENYSYGVALVLGIVFVGVLLILYRDRKPGEVVRNKTRDNMFARLRRTGKLNKAPGDPIAKAGQAAANAVPATPATGAKNGAAATGEPPPAPPSAS